MITAQQAATKWANRLASSQDQIKAGVMSVTVNPAQKAIAQKDAWRDGVLRAHADGKFERGLGRVTLQSWQQAMIDKGLARVASGATAGKGKMESFLGKWLPHMQGLKQMLEGMPRGTPEQNKQRMLAAFDYNASFKMT